jgi:flagellar P-ring protein precursor FlgI
MRPFSFLRLTSVAGCAARALAVIALACAALPVTAPVAHAERLKDLVQIQGVRDNPLIGYGLVVGLDGTGDQTMQTPFTTQTLANMLANLGISINNQTAGSNSSSSNSLSSMQLKNVAAVMVTASLPAFARPGEAIDVTVSSLGNAKSLRGGTLLLTPLKGADGQVYALAQGNMAVGGAGASANGSKVQVNQLAAGRIAGGALVERSVPTTISQAGTMQLDLNDMDYDTTQRITSAINNAFGFGTAVALDGRTIQLRAPTDPAQQVQFMAQLQNLDVKPGQAAAKAERAHGLHRDEPDGDAADLRRGAWQSIGDRQHATGGEPAGRVLERPDGGCAAVADRAEAGQRRAQDGERGRESGRSREGAERARRDARRSDVDPPGHEGSGCAASRSRDHLRNSKNELRYDAHRRE